MYSSTPPPSSTPSPIGDKMLLPVRKRQSFQKAGDMETPTENDHTTTTTKTKQKNIQNPHSKQDKTNPLKAKKRSKNGKTKAKTNLSSKIMVVFIFRFVSKMLLYLRTYLVRWSATIHDWCSECRCTLVQQQTSLFFRHNSGIRHVG